MSKDKHANEDIVQQRYKGASPVVAALGEGAVHTKFFALSGLAIGAAAAFFFHKQTAPLIEKFNASIGKLSASESPYIKPIGETIEWLLAFGRGPVKWAKERDVVRSMFKNTSPETISRVKDAFEGGIIVSTAAGLAGSITGGGAGIHQARAGKHQFDDAKSEISTLRAKLIDTQAELEDAKTAHAAKKGTLKVADDQTPAITSEPEVAADKTTEFHAPKHAHTKTKASSWTEEVATRQAQQGELAL